MYLIRGTITKQIILVTCSIPVYEGQRQYLETVDVSYYCLNSNTILPFDMSFCVIFYCQRQKRFSNSLHEFLHSSNDSNKKNWKSRSSRLENKFAHIKNH